MKRLPGTIYLAPDGFESQLRHELGVVTHGYGRLLLSLTEPADVHWAQNTWFEPTLLPIASIGDAVRQLTSLQRNWAHFPFASHRRAELIAAQLPHVSAKPLQFPSALPTAPLGSWTLLDAETLLFSKRCSSPVPHGEFQFVEEKVGPPSRAYLKLWEALTRLQLWPKPGERCLEAGASPGGWTWALQRLGAQVLCVDRAPLAPNIAALPGVEFRRGDAFSLLPENVGPIDWLFSDVICYPDKLLDWIQRWMDSGLCRRFVCTIKFQGGQEEIATKAFAAIPGATVTHLFNNKHELTFMKVD